MIDFYCGINEVKWNYHPVSPGKYACVSPVIGSTIKGRRENNVHVPNTVDAVIQDSGAFCDGPGNRLNFDGALERQIRHANKYNYLEKITHRASYDLLIDEKWSDDGTRKKERWDEESSWDAVSETIDSASFLSRNRMGLNLVLSAQGVTTKQYLTCAEEIVPLMTEGDIFGFGGWCIIGRKRNNLRESFREIILSVVPYLSEKGVSKIHIWGVLYANAIGELLWICDKYNIRLSTDSAGPQMRPALGSWGYADWKNPNYKQPPTEIRGQERAKHVQLVIDWLHNFRKTKYYKSPETNEKWIK